MRSYGISAQNGFNRDGTRYASRDAQMARKGKEHLKSSENRERVDVTLPADLVRWVDALVKDRTYATRSHAVEKALLELRKNRPP